MRRVRSRARMFPQVVNEIPATAIAHGLDKNMCEHILVHDFVDGPFDVLPLAIDNGVVEVFAMADVAHLGVGNYYRMSYIIQHIIKMSTTKALFDDVEVLDICTFARFDELDSDLLVNILDPDQQCLEDSGRDQTQIDEVVLV